ncbi:hypothetical protein GGR95_003662 [Sulfitobacter undariae]|uniref:HYR domain-containing protein n=1 Tax=Sulfitobacter undariae TaxID=1563671 RepID=A0A7W6E9P1_9RHOB|nr:HYR domain-containing protein [Sulfitobacter undariae]MBB3995996.1 hypothetical protein [Sulfitobacter undariae]
MWKKLFAGLIAVTLATAGSTAYGFNRGDIGAFTVQFGADCWIEGTNPYDTLNAYVRLTASGVTYHAGGSHFKDGVIVSSRPITLDLLQACVGEASVISNLTQNGADGSFYTDDYIGLSYRQTFPSGASYMKERQVGAGSMPANVIPTADAGTAVAVASGTQVTLNGSGTDSDGTIDSYAWNRNGGTGTGETFTGETTAEPSFTAPTLQFGDVDQTFIYDLVVSDNLGAVSAASSVTITVTAPADTEPPVIYATPGFVSIGTDLGKITASVALYASVIDTSGEVIEPVFTLNGSTITSPHVFPVGTSTVTVTAQDSAGNKATPQQFDVNVTDREGPVISALSEVSVNTDAGSHTASLTMSATVTDNSGETITPTFTSGSFPLLNQHDFPIGTTTVTVRANDLAGNEAVPVQFDVTVTDAEAPVISGTSNVSANTNPGASTASVTLNATVTDNALIDPSPVFTANGATITSPHNFPIGTTTVTVTAQDVAGNAATPVNFDVIVTDVGFPEISGTSDVSVNTDAGANTASVVLNATVTDNSGEMITPVFSVYGSPVTSPRSFPIGTTTVTVTAQDSVGNAATPVTFDVTVTDAEVPVISGTSNVSVNTDAGANTASVVLNATVTDNSGETITPAFTVDGSAITSPHSFPIGTTTVTVGAQDSADNAATPVTFNVTVSDADAPVISSTSDVLVNAAAGTSTALVPLNATVSDNSGETITPVFSVYGSPITSPRSFPVGTTEVTVTAQDSAGNAATPVTFNVIVADAEAPVISGTADISVDADAGANTASVAFTASATDNSGHLIMLEFSVDGSTVTSPHTFPVGTTTVTVNARDGAGNTATPVSFNVTVSDANAPVISGTADISTNTDAGANTASVPLNATVSDDSGETIVPAFTVDGSPVTSPHAFPLGTTAVTVSAQDSAGNAATPVTFNVVVADAGAPVISGTADVSVGTDAGANTAFVVLNASVTDNSGETLTPVFTADGSAVTSPHSFPAGTTTVTVSAQDSAGNVATPVTFDVTVTDAGAPVISGIADVSVNTDAGMNTASVVLNATVADNSGETITPTFTVGGSTVTNLHNFPIGTTKVSVTAQDSAGNAATPVTFNVTVADAGAPVISGTADITVNTASVVLNATVTDNSGEMIAPVFTVDGSAVTSPHVFPAGKTTVTVTAQDSAGNAATPVSFNVTVADAIAPVISGTSDVSVTTDADVNTASVVLNATVSDNSGETITPEFSVDGSAITSPHAFPVGTTEVTVTAQDSAGNQATPVVFTVVIQDTTVPAQPVASAPTSTPDGRPNVSGTAEPGSIVTVTFPDGSTQSVTADPVTGAFSLVAHAAQRSGDITIVAADAAGNVSQTLTLKFAGDDVAPTVTIAALSGPVNGTYTAAITLSEASSDFTASDLALVNADATLTGSGLNYIAIVTPTADGEVSLSVPAGVLNDAAGNPNTASNVVKVMHDAVAPTVSITGAPESAASSSSFAVTVTFSEDVIGFDGADMATKNARVTGVSGSGSVYAVSLIATGAGDVILTVPANGAYDAAGNGNLASNTVSIDDTTVERTQELIAGFMQTRVNQLVRNQPDLMAFLSGNGKGELDLYVTRGYGNFDFASRPDYPVWVRATGAWSNDEDSKGKYLFGAFGGHQKINENLLLGGMLQFDHLTEETGVAKMSGTGWMAGPYLVAKSANHPLHFEGRLLYGETSNKISPFGTYEDDFDSKRFLAQFKVAGEMDYGATILTPFFDISYTTDDQEAYEDTMGNTIPKQGIELGQIEFGMDFNRTISIPNGEFELWGGVSGIWSHTSGSGYASTVTPDYEGGRGRVELGVGYDLPHGQSFNAATFYDGIGANSFESFGLSLGYEATF